MIPGDLLSAVPYAIGAGAGFVVGVVVGRVDWNQRVLYWRQRALSKASPAPEPASPTPVAPAVRLVVPTPRNHDTRTDAA